MISRVLSVLRTKTRERADMVGSDFVSDDEVNTAINYAGRSLFGLLIEAYGEGHFESSATFATVSGTYDYAELPADFYRLIGFTALVNSASSSATEIVLRRGTTEDMLRNTVTDYGWQDSGTVFYQLRGQTIRLSPTPTAVHTVTIRYISANLFFDTNDAGIVELAADTDKMNMEDLLWEDFIITHAAIRLQDKEQTDNSALQAALARVAAQLSEAASKRDQGEAQRIRMVM